MIDGFMDLSYNTTRIYKSISKFKKKHMRFLDIKVSHAFCLYYLAQAEEGRTPGELCQLCSEDKAGISRNLKEMEKMGLIYLKSCSHARRYRTKVYLTPMGRSKAADLELMLGHTNEIVFRGFSAEEKAILHRALTQAADVLDRLLQASPTEEDEAIIRELRERQNPIRDTEGD